MGAQRKINSTTQASFQSWTPQRRKAVARFCLKIFGGLPSERRLRKSYHPELKALAIFLKNMAEYERFATEFNIPRTFNRAPKGEWKTQENQQKTRDLYRDICVAFGRYVNDMGLSLLNARNISLRTPAFANVKGNSLRHRIKVDLGMPIRKLFLFLCQSEDLPLAWAKQAKIPTSRDGKTFDSYSEVRWWEALQDALSQLPTTLRQHLITTYHPYIGTTRIEADFRVNAIYIEVLQFSLSQLASPDGIRMTQYAENFEKHQLAYASQDLQVFYVEPYLLADGSALSEQLEQILSAASKTAITDINVNVASHHPPGYWFAPENRDAAIRSLINLKKTQPGRYPTSQTLCKNGLTGLQDFLVSHRSIELQDEALRVHTIRPHFGKYKARTPTLKELLEVCDYHHAVLMDQNGDVTLDTLYRTFGRGCPPFFAKIDKDYLVQINDSFRSKYKIRSSSPAWEECAAISDPVDTELIMSLHLKKWGEKRSPRHQDRLPFGFYYQDRNRDYLVKFVNLRLGLPPGRFPGMSKFASAGFKGMGSFYDLPQGRKIDRQSEAVRCHTLSFKQGANNPRLPTVSELIDVCSHHLETLLDSNGQITKETVLATFGWKSMKHLSAIVDDPLKFLMAQLHKRDKLPV